MQPNSPQGVAPHPDGSTVTDFSQVTDLVHSPALQTSQCVSLESGSAINRLGNLGLVKLPYTPFPSPHKGGDAFLSRFVQGGL